MALKLTFETEMKGAKEVEKYLSDWTKRLNESGDAGEKMSKHINDGLKSISESLDTLTKSGGGVSSITDLGVGTPQFNLDTALSAANGTLWNNCGYYGSVGSEIPVQGGGRVSSTTTWKAYCGSNGTTRVDWVEGYSGLIR